MVLILGEIELPKNAMFILPEHLFRSGCFKFVIPLNMSHKKSDAFIKYNFLGYLLCNLKYIIFPCFLEQDMWAWKNPRA